MKKLLALALALTMILCLGACVREPTAEELYTLVSEKNATAEKLNATLTVNGSMTLGVAGISKDIEFDVSGSLLGENIGKEDMKMAMPMEVKMMGMSVNTDVYFADGWYLMEVVGQKLKCPMDIDLAMEQLSGTELQPLEYVTLDELVFDENAKLYTIPYTMDIDKAVEMSSDALGMTGVNLSELEGIVWDDCSGVIVTDKDGNISSQHTVISFSAEMEGAEMSCNMSVVVTYNDIPDDFTVQIPDTADFIEVDPETMGFEAA